MLSLGGTMVVEFQDIRSECTKHPDSECLKEVEQARDVFIALLETIMSKKGAMRLRLSHGLRSDLLQKVFPYSRRSASPHTLLTSYIKPMSRLAHPCAECAPYAGIRIYAFLFRNSFQICKIQPGFPPRSQIFELTSLRFL